MRYHINDKGQPGVCNATVGPCKFAPADEHFESYESAAKMADFKHEAEINLTSALSHYPIESLETNELRSYRRIVMDNLNKKHEEVEGSLDEPEKHITQEEVDRLWEEAKEEILNEGFQEKIDNWSHLQKNFDNKPWKNGVPRGLIENFNNGKIAKLFAKEFFVDENNQLDVDDDYRLDKRYQNIKESRIFRNFKGASLHYYKIAKENISKFRISKISNEEMNNEFIKRIEERTRNKVKTYKPIVEIRKSNNRVIKQSNVNRKEIIASLNKEMTIRNNLSKFTNNPIRNRYNSNDFKDGANELEMTAYINDKNEIDNLYLMGNDKKFYKVISFVNNAVVVKDNTGLTKTLTTKKDGFKHPDLRDDYSFIEVEVPNKDLLHTFKGNKTIYKNT